LIAFAQTRVAQLDLAPTLAVFVSRSAILKPLRFARDYSARATLAVAVETHRLRTSDAERVLAKPFCISRCNDISVHVWVLRYFEINLY